MCNIKKLEIDNAMFFVHVLMKLWSHHIWLIAVSLYVVFCDCWDRLTVGLDSLEVTGRLTVYCSQRFNEDMCYKVNVHSLLLNQGDSD